MKLFKNKQIILLLIISVISLSLALESSMTSNLMKRRRSSKRGKAKSALQMKKSKFRLDQLDLGTCDDPVVVYDLAVVGGSKYVSCPAGFEKVMNGGRCDTTYGCDLNNGTGGDYIYLCMKRKKFSELQDGELPINVVDVLLNSKECGSYKLINQDLNSDRIFSNAVYMCYGHNKNVEIAPVSTIFFIMQSKAYNNPTPQPGVDCNLTDLNSRAGGDHIYICFVRALDAPKGYFFTNLILDESQNKMDPVDSTFLDYVIDNGNGLSPMSISKSIKEGLASSVTFEETTKFGLSITKKATVGDDKVAAATVTMGFSFNYAGVDTNTKTTLKENETQYTCTAPEGKYYKCSINYKKQQLNMPYKVQRITEFYDGRKSDPVTISGTVKGVQGSNFYSKACCYQFCDEKDILCAGAKLTDKNPCPALPPSSNAPAIDTKATTLTYDPEIIYDFKLLAGDKKQTCPPNYQVVASTNCPSQGCDFNKGAVGDTIYLCIAKKKISKLTATEKPINEYRILIDNNDCGILKRDGVNFNKGTWGGDDIYMCYGNDPYSKNPPITDIFIHIKGTNNPPSDYICDGTDLNKGVMFSDTIKFCVKRDKKAPKRLDIYGIDIQNMRKVSQSAPDAFYTLEVSGGKATKTLTNIKEHVYKTSLSLEFAASLKVTVKSPQPSQGGLPVSFAYETSLTFSKAGKWETTETNTNTEKTTFTCEAPRGKTMRCVYFQTKSLMYGDMVAKADVFGYENEVTKIDTIDLKSTLTDLTSDSISMKVCCLSGCTAKDVQCDQALKCFKQKRKFIRRKMK